MTQSQHKLLQIISESSFALDDTILFLDTHPCDHEALCYYNKMQEVYQNALKEYQEQYGPLLNEDVNCQNGWTWVDDPWPWEWKGGCH